MSESDFGAEFYRPWLILSRSEARALDEFAIRRASCPAAVLMERAALGAMAVVLKEIEVIEAPSVVILCGKGNNAGDGLALARLLRSRGCSTEAWELLPDQELSAEASRNRSAAESLGVSVVKGRVARDLGNLPPNCVLVDAMLGTGLRGKPRSPLDDWIQAANRSGRVLVSLDVPSGLDADTGLAEGAAIKASTTVSFGSSKAGFHKPWSREFVGRLKIVDIGWPIDRLEEALVYAKSASSKRDDGLGSALS